MVNDFVYISGIIYLWNYEYHNSNILVTNIFK